MTTERQSAEIIQALATVAEGFSRIATGLLILTEVLQEQHDESYAENKETADAID